LFLEQSRDGPLADRVGVDRVASRGLMAIGPARHLEHAIRNMEPRPDIKLHHLALDIGQVLEEDFPRKIPTKREAEKERERLEDFRRAVAAGDTGAKRKG
jgi:hypothetical protein